MSTDISQATSTSLWVGGLHAEVSARREFAVEIEHVVSVHGTLMLDAEEAAKLRDWLAKVLP